MEALKCDICNSKLVMQVGEIAVCDCCGVEYSTQRLREMFAKLNNSNLYTTNNNEILFANELFASGDVDKSLDYYQKYSASHPDDEEAKNKIHFIETEKKRVLQKGELIKAKVIALHEFGIFCEVVRKYRGYGSHFTVINTRNQILH